MPLPSISFGRSGSHRPPAGKDAHADLLAALIRGEPVAWPFVDAEAEHQFLDAAQQHGVLPLVGRQHRRKGVLSAWPETLRTTIAARVRQHSIVEQVNRAELMAILGELASRRVRTIVFKGAALAHTHYPYSCLRPREDVDLLVHESQVDDAAEALRARAYVPLEGVTGRLVTYQQTFVRTAGPAVRHAVDLHWRVSNRVAFSRLLPWEDIAASARPIPALDGQADGLAPPQTLLLACLHRVAHHFDARTLIWLYDIHLVTSSLTDDEAARFVALAMDSGLAAICARGIALAHRRFGTTLPRAVERLAPAGDEPLAAYMDERFRPIDMLLSDLCTLSGLRPRWQLLREHLFPSTAYLRASQPWLGSGPLPILYARRILRGASRWLRPCS